MDQIVAMMKVVCRIPPLSLPRNAFFFWAMAMISLSPVRLSPSVSQSDFSTTLIMFIIGVRSWSAESFSTVKPGTNTNRLTLTLMIVSWSAVAESWCVHQKRSSSHDVRGTDLRSKIENESRKSDRETETETETERRETGYGIRETGDGRRE